MPNYVRLEKDAAPGVAAVLLERPPMNALNSQVTEEILEVAKQLENSEDVRAFVLWGGQKIFAAGADIKEFLDFSNEDAKRTSQRMNEAFARLADLPQISVAAVNGYALGGGCELAMCADFRVAGEDAVFGQPEILLGIIPGAGGTQRLPRLVGVSRAKEIVFSGRQIKAKEALTIGLADQVTAPEDAYRTALEMARRFAVGPAALRAAKRSINQGIELPLASALDVESEEFAAAFSTADARVGITSFLERGPGKATFTGA